MAEVSLTKWLDPALDYFAKEAGIPVADYSSQVGGEGIGNALEIAADFFTKGWLNKAIQGIAGLVADCYAIWGKNVPTRLRKELLGVGTHELLRIVDPKPSDLIEMRQSLQDFVAAAQRGDWNAAMASVLRSPAEIQAMLGVMRLVPPPPAPVPPAGAPTPAPTPEEIVSTALPEIVQGAKYAVRGTEVARGTVSSGRYTVTG